MTRSELIMRLVRRSATASQAESPRHVLIAGVPASGKTTLSRKLARELKLPVIHADNLPASKGHEFPGSDELRTKLTRLKKPHIVEGVQVMGRMYGTLLSTKARRSSIKAR